MVGLLNSGHVMIDLFIIQIYLVGSRRSYKQLGLDRDVCVGAPPATANSLSCYWAEKKLKRKICSPYGCFFSILTIKVLSFKCKVCSFLQYLISPVTANQIMLPCHPSEVRASLLSYCLSIKIIIRKDLVHFTHWYFYSLSYLITKSSKQLFLTSAESCKDYYWLLYSYCKQFWST